MARTKLVLLRIFFHFFAWSNKWGGGTPLLAQWYSTPSGDRLITYYGPDEECEVYGSSEAVNRTLEAAKGCSRNPIGFCRLHCKRDS